jgi:hypothetical protein
VSAAPLQLQRTLNVRSHAGFTALHTAARLPGQAVRVRAKACAMLLAAGADPLVGDASSRLAFEYLALAVPATLGSASEGGAGAAAGAAAAGSAVGTAPTTLLPFAFNAAFSDCTISLALTAPEGAGSRALEYATFPAHKVVLAAASPFFAAALGDKWAAAAAAAAPAARAAAPPPPLGHHFELHLLAGQVPTFQRLLKFVYGHSLQELGLPPGAVGPLMDLLAAADALDVRGLVQACEGALAQCLGVDSVCEVLQQALGLQGCSRLTLHACKHLLGHFAEVAAAVPWEVALGAANSALQYLMRV